MGISVYGVAAKLLELTNKIAMNKKLGIHTTVNIVIKMFNSQCMFQHSKLLQKLISINGWLFKLALYMASCATPVTHVWLGVLHV